jgi:hypothetical protein
LAVGVDQELAAAYAAGATVAELAKRLDVTRKTVRARLTRAGVPGRRRGRPIQIDILADQDWLRREYVQRKRSAADIARELACSPTAVLDALRRHDLPVRDRGGGNRRQPMPKELQDFTWLNRRYSSEGASIRQIAVEVNVSGSAVAAALRRAGIKRRPVGNQSAAVPVQGPVPISRTGVHRPLGLLPDGTGYFAQLGKLEFVEDGRRVVCHLCGKSFRLLSASHLRRHGWTSSDYRFAFGLNRGTPLCAADESARRREIGLERYRNNRRVRDGLARGQEMVRSGEALAMAHAAMPRGTARLQRRLQAAAGSQNQRDALRASAEARRAQSIRELGFRSEGAYLKDRYVRRGWGIAPIKAELQVGSGVVESLLDAAGIERRPPGGRRSVVRRDTNRIEGP